MASPPITNTTDIVGHWQWDVDQDAVIWSDSMYAIYGVEPGTPMTYATYLERVHPEDRERASAVVQAAFRDHTRFDYEHRLVRPDGTIRHVRAQGYMISDAGGRVLRMVGTGHDITPAARAQ